jgi:hypothetical protein
MGIIMVGYVRLRFAAIPAIAAAMIAATTASGWAFSQQTLGPGESGNYNFNYTDPNRQATPGTRPSDSNSSGFHFSVQQGQTGPFGFQSGSHFGNSGNATAPDYYARPLGNGN